MTGLQRNALKAGNPKNANSVLTAGMVAKKVLSNEIINLRIN
jgi:hypothetical protein